MEEKKLTRIEAMKGMKKKLATKNTKNAKDGATDTLLKLVLLPQDSLTNFLI